MLESERIFIDTGTRAAIPRLDGLDQVDFLTNATIMQLSELPEHLLVMGSGYIGLEFGQMFRRLRQPCDRRQSRGTYPSSRRHGRDRRAATALEGEGIRFIFGADTTRVVKQDGQIELQLKTAGGPQNDRGSHLLVATGRRPNTDDLGLETTGVQLTPEGFIQVNGKLETNVPGIWALGDVKGGPAFTHVSFNDYQIVYGNLIEGKNLTKEHRLIPYSLFTDPQLGRIGLTEKQARDSGRKLRVGKIPVARVARAIERDETAGLMKIVVDADSDRILGASILSAEGGELVQIIGFVMLAGAPYTLLKGAIYIHPTLAEGFWNLMEDVKPA